MITRQWCSEGEPARLILFSLHDLWLLGWNLFLFWFRNSFLLNPNISFSHMIFLHQWQETFLLFLTHVCMSCPIKTKMESLNRFVPRKPLNWKWTWRSELKWDSDWHLSFCWAWPSFFGGHLVAFTLTPSLYNSQSSVSNTAPISRHQLAERSF